MRDLLAGHVTTHSRYRARGNKYLETRRDEIRLVRSCTSFDALKITRKRKREKERVGGREREREREKESFLHNSSPHTITSRVANPFARLVFRAVTLHGFSRGVDARAAMFPPRKNKAHCSVLLASSERKRERERERESRKRFTWHSGE